jgi:tripartite-type tricarboxylate transporter receptor subunit TctC
MNNILKQLVVVASFLQFSFVSYADTYPSRAVTLVVPFAAGGATDLLGRSLADGLSREWKQAVIVENRPGAGTSLAGEYVARAKPDGHTLLLASTTTMVLNPLMSTRLRYSPADDLTPVSLLAEAPLVMLINSRSSASQLSDWISLAKNNPNLMNFGSAGVGSSIHLAGELFKSMAKLEMIHIPYKGSQPALSALITDEIQTYFDLIPSAKPFIDSGQLKALAVTSSHSLPNLPNVKTFEELGFKDFVVSPYFYLMVASQTPAPLVEKINADVIKVLSNPNLQLKFAEQSMYLRPSAPDAVKAHIAKSKLIWQPLIKARSISLD